MDFDLDSSRFWICQTKQCVKKLRKKCVFILEQCIEASDGVKALSPKVLSDDMHL